MFCAMSTNSPNTCVYNKSAVKSTYPTDETRLLCCKKRQKKDIERSARRTIKLYIRASWE